MLQVAKAVCGTDLVHLAVDARGDHCRLARKAEVLEIVDTLLGAGVVANERTALDRIVGLGRMETERVHVAGIENRLAVQLDIERMGGIIDYRKAVAVGDFLNCVDIAGIAIDVHRHDGGRFRRNRLFNLLRVEIARRGVHVHEHRSEPVPPDGVRRCDETVRCCYDFARDAHGLERCNQRKRSVCEQADVFHAEIFGKRLFQFLVVMPVIGKPLAVPDVLEIWSKFFQ